MGPMGHIKLADTVVSTGLAALEYKYINLGDYWAGLNRDSKVLHHRVPKKPVCSFSCLFELALLYCQRIVSDTLSEIGKGCKFLQALHLVDCSGVGDDSISSIAKGCKNLRKLHIRRCYEVGNKGIIVVGQNCKSLSDLSLQFCDRIGDATLISIGQGCSLHHLNVSGCDRIRDARIIAIARGSPQLSSLDVSVLQVC